MAVPDQIPVSTHTGNGSATAFAFQYLALLATDLAVTVNGVVKVLSVDYTVSGLNNEAGGTVTFSVAPTNGAAIIIERDVTLDRQTDYQYAGDFKARNINLDLDRIWMALQGAFFRLKRALTFPLGDPTDGTLPTIALRAGNLLGFDGQGRPIAISRTLAELVQWIAELVGAVPRTLRSKLGDVISVKDFGAKGDGTTNDTAAFQLAMNSGARSIFMPAGTYNINAVDVPATVKELYGAGGGTTLVGVGTMPGFSPFLEFASLDNFDIHDFAISINKTTYLTNHALYIGGCTNGVVRNIHIRDGGYFGVYAPGCTRVTFRDIQVDSFATGAFRADTGSNYITVDTMRTLSAGTSHSVQIIGGTQHAIRNCNIFKSGPVVFGINYLGVTDSVIQNNQCVTDTVEGINVQDSVRASIVGNTVTCLAGHHDFGISMYGATSPNTHTLVAGNRVYFPGKSGIAMASTVGQPCKQNHIVGNLIVSPNQLNEAMGAAVILYGSTLCSENTVQANTLIDEGTTAKYVVNEWNDGGGNPQFNYLIDNAVVSAGGLVRQNNLLTSTSQAWDLRPETFTPTVTPSSGAITSSTAAGSYRRRGKKVDLSFSVGITNNGTGAGSITLSTPLTAMSNGCINGRESATGQQLNGVQSGSSVLIRTYHNQYPAATGATLSLSGTMDLT